MVVATEQYIPERVAVSLETTQFIRYIITHNRSSPAVDHNRLVSSPPLNLYNLLIHVSYSLEVLTLSTALPVSDVELDHLVGLLGLHGGNKE